MQWKQVLCDFWYSRELGPDCVSFEVYLATKVPPAVLELFLRVAPLRAAALCWYGRDFETVIPDWYRYGRLICVLAAIFTPRRLVVVECIDIDPASKGRLFQVIYRFLSKAVLGPAMRLSVKSVQMMTNGEADRFSDTYGYDRSRIQVVAWPLAGWSEAVNIPGTIARPAEAYVFSSGRAACDWQTLMQAANTASWPLVIVCSANDRARIDALNASGAVTVYQEISRVDHDWLLAGATIYALCLKEEHKSSGQVRLAACIAAGVPVVATAVSGIEDYLMDGTNALAVPVGDPSALREATDRLWIDEPTRKVLTETARASAAHYTRADYFQRIRDILSPEARREA